MTGDDGFSYQVPTFFCLFSVLVAFEATQAKQSTFEPRVLLSTIDAVYVSSATSASCKLFFPPSPASP
jgi:hypothetical protein